MAPRNCRTNGLRPTGNTMRVSNGSSRSATLGSSLRSPAILILAAGTLIGCASAPAAQRPLKPDTDQAATITIPAGTFQFSLPRAICDSDARVGDTVTTRVTRPTNEIDRGMISIGRDTTVPAELKAVLRVSQVGPATGDAWFPVVFAVDAFVLDGRRGQVVISRLRIDPEAVHAKESAGKMVHCYRARLTGETTSALVLSEK
jgi:hypothetical protein